MAKNTFRLATVVSQEEFICVSWSMFINFDKINTFLHQGKVSNSNGLGAKRG